MSAPGPVRAQKPGSASGFGTAALLKVIANPLKRRNPQEPKQGTVFNRCASSDPVNAVLEGEIIPRLMMAHVVSGSLGPKEEPIEIDAQDAQTFATLPLRLEAPGLLEEVDRFLEQGVSVEDAYLDLLAPAARHLGDLWNRDECDFVDVTMGLWRLQEVMREISLRTPLMPCATDAVRRALFCPIPGDVHSFGAQMIEEVFARGGWNSEVLLKTERRELLDYVAKNPVDLVGLTISRNGPVSALASLIKAVRSVTQNPRLVVLVGGHMINENPALVAEIGADGTGLDARAALETAEQLVPAAPSRARELM